MKCDPRLAKLDMYLLVAGEMKAILLYVGCLSAEMN
jgi:hypothetical protein